MDGFTEVPSLLLVPPVAIWITELAFFGRRVLVTAILRRRQRCFRWLGPKVVDHLWIIGLKDLGFCLDSFLDSHGMGS